MKTRESSCKQARWTGDWQSAFHTGLMLGLGWWPSPSSSSSQQVPSGPKVKFWRCKKPRVQTQMPEGTLNKYNCILSTQVCFCLYIKCTEIFFNSTWKHALYSFFSLKCDPLLNMILFPDFVVIMATEVYFLWEENTNQQYQWGHRTVFSWSWHWTLIGSGGDCSKVEKCSARLNNAWHLLLRSSRPWLGGNAGAVSHGFNFKGSWKPQFWCALEWWFSVQERDMQTKENSPAGWI